MKTKTANVQTDPVHLLPKLTETKDGNVQTDPVQSVPCCSETTSNMLRSSNTDKIFCSSRSRHVRRRQQNGTYDDCTWQVCSKPSDGLIKTFRKSPREKRDINGVASHQPLAKFRQSVPPVWSLEPTLASHCRLVENSSAACHSSHISVREKSRSGHFDCSRTRPVSQSHERQSNTPLMDRRSRLKTGSSRHGKKSGSSSLYKRSRNVSPTEECSGSFDRARDRELHHSSSRRSVKSTSRKRSLQHSESGVKSQRSADSTSRKKSLQHSESGIRSPRSAESISRKRSLQHSESGVKSHRSADSTSRKRLLRHSESLISASRSKCRRLERSTRNWQLAYSQNRTFCSSLVHPAVMFPLCSYLPPTSFHCAVPILFPRLFLFSAAPLFCPPFVIPIPLWNLWRHL